MNELVGLVLAGGRSTRMGTDKGLLQYHGKTQLEWCQEILRTVCSRVFVSARKGQYDLPVIEDPYEEGPLGGILSAFEQIESCSLLVLACDMPNVDQELLANLVAARDMQATYYLSVEDGLPEPLCAIWERSCVEEIKKTWTEGIRCPRKFLLRLRSERKKELTGTSGKLRNINTHQEGGEKPSRPYQALTAIGLGVFPS